MSASAPIDHRKAARRGPEPLPAVELRTHTVSVRVNAVELRKLDGQRESVQMLRGEWLRCAALHQLPPTIPSVNREAWSGLSRAAGNLNQIARRLNEAAAGLEAGAPDPKEIGEVLADFRRALIGARHPDEGEE